MFRNGFNRDLQCCFDDVCGPCGDFDFGGDFDGGNGNGCGCGCPCERGRERVFDRQGRTFIENVHHNIIRRNVYHHMNGCDKHCFR